MNKQEREDVNATIENEGFDYAFCDYSDFEEINDEKFHKLRKAYIKASEELKKYIEL